MTRSAAKHPLRVEIDHATARRNALATGPSGPKSLIKSD